MAPCPRHVWIAVNGILSWSGESDGWTDRAVTWLHLHTSSRAEKWEYTAGALTRRVRQDDRAQAIATMVRFYIAAGYEVSFLVHSNGADIFERVLELVAPIRIRSAHVVAGASDGQLLLRALDDDRLGWLHLYGSANDKALKLAELSRKVVGWLGLGYGSIGRELERFAALAPRTTVHRDDTQGHSSWWERGEAFDRTMRLISANEYEPEEMPTEHTEHTKA